MRDGLYRVRLRGGITAGFVICNGRVTACAPVLRAKIHQWKKTAVRIGR